MDDNTIGATTALIKRINTNNTDGSVSVTLDMLPQDQKIISKLMEMYLNNQRSVTVAFVRPDEQSSDGWGL